MATLSISALNGASPILQRELGAYFRSPVGTVFLVIFLLTALGCPFFLGNFYRSDHAGLELFFAFHPWLYLILVPALGMSVWAEEFQHSTILLLFTLPVSVGAAVIAKFLAGWIFLGFALLLTFPIVATVFYLGHPDIGPILTGYFGSFMMAGVYLAITTCTSAIGRNQIVSYALSTILCLVLVLLGQGALMDLLNPIFPVWLVDVISWFSFSTHFLSLGLGRVDSRDIVYFVTLIAFFLLANTIVIQVKMGRTQAKRAAINVVQLLLALISVNVISHYLPARFDVTQDKVYTISAGTRKILSNIEHPILVKLFFSKSNEELTPDFKLYAQQVQDLLKEYVRLSDHKLVLEVIDPQADTLEEEWAQRFGIRKTVLANGSPLYFGLAALTMGREFVIPSFEPDRAGELEYDLSQRILRIATEKRDRIGVIGLSDTDNIIASRFSGFIGELRKSYAVSFLPKETTTIDDDIALLVLVWTNGRAAQSPTFIQGERIEKFVQRGGKLLVVVDPLFGAASPSPANTTSGSGNGFPYAGLLEGWGVRFTSGEIVGDLKSAGMVQNPGLGNIRYPFLIRLGDDGISKNFPLTRGMGQLVFLHSGFFQSIKPPLTGALNELIPLISSSNESGIYDFLHTPLSPLHKETGNVERKSGLPSLLSRNRDLLSDRTGSQFSMSSSSSKNTKELQDVDRELRNTQGSTILAGLITRQIGASPRTPIAVVIADADFLSDDLTISTLQQTPASNYSDAGTRQIALAASGNFDSSVTEARSNVQQVNNDNIGFALNSIDYLLGKEGLSGIRSRSRNFRDFTRVRELEKDAQQKFLAAEEISERNLSAIRLSLDQAMKSRERDQKLLFSEQQRITIKSYLDREAEIKKDLTATRRLLRNNIDTLGNRLLILNLLPVPLLVAFSGGIYFWRRSRRHQVTKKL